MLHTGNYRGQCTQFCGLYHSEMFFSVKAVPPAQFTPGVADRVQQDAWGRTPAPARELPAG